AYVAHTAKTNRSAYKDAAVLQGFMESVGDRLITEISPFHIERWKRERAGDVSRSTVNRELNIIRGCFSRAVEWDRLSLSPMRRIKAYRVDDVRLRVCTPAEIKTLLESTTAAETKSTRTPRPGAVALADLRLLARLTLESLPRLSECLALRRDDIGSTYATIVRSKSGRARQVPLTPELRADLLARCHASGSVFGVGTEG